MSLRERMKKTLSQGLHLKPQMTFMLIWILHDCAIKKTIMMKIVLKAKLGMSYCYFMVIKAVPEREWIIYAIWTKKSWGILMNKRVIGEKFKVRTMIFGRSGVTQISFDCTNFDPVKYRDQKLLHEHWNSWPILLILANTYATSSNKMHRYMWQIKIFNFQSGIITNWSEYSPSTILTVHNVLDCFISSIIMSIWSLLKICLKLLDSYEYEWNQEKLWVSILWNTSSLLNMRLIGISTTSVNTSLHPTRFHRQVHIHCCCCHSLWWGSRH